MENEKRVDLSWYPTANAVEVVHGRWIRTHFISPVWKCSECGEQINRASMIGYNYCPNCGAKMDGEGNGV